MAGYRIWQSGDEFLVQFEVAEGSGTQITFSRAEITAFIDGLSAAAALNRPSNREHTRPGPLRDALISELYAAGAPISEIAERAEISHAGIHGVLRRLGVPPRSNRRAASAKRRAA